MARKLVTHYAVFHDVGSTSEISLYYQGGGRDVVSGIPVAEAAYLVDLLRNERPIAYDAERRRLFTSAAEPVGESE